MEKDLENLTLGQTENEVSVISVSQISEQIEESKVATKPKKKKKKSY